MITRSKGKKYEQLRKERDMASNDSIIEQVREDNDSSGSIQIDNQLGIPGIYDEEIERINEQGFIGRECPQVEVIETHRESPEVTQNKAGGQTTTPQMGEFEKIFAMLQRIQEESKSQQQEIKEKMEIQHQEIKEEQKAMKAELKAEMQTLKKEVRDEIKQVRDELKTEINAVKKESEKTRAEVKEIRDVIKNIQTEIAQNKQQIVVKTNNLSDNLNRINKEIRTEIKQQKEDVIKMKKDQEEMGEQVKRIEEEKKRRIDELKESQEQLKRRINEVEGRPINRVANETYKEVTFNGKDHYPMEFLKELRDIQQYYTEDDVRWIARHLTDEATTWWRIIKNEVNNFRDFEEQFTHKYWSAQVQEGIRDRLEYGRYYPNGSVSAIQYMQKHILQCRQLMPPITDQHLIKKLARHYGRDIELAVLTRGIREFPQFEALLYDYIKINITAERVRRHYNGDNGPDVKNEETNDSHPRHGHKGAYKGGYSKKNHPQFEMAEPMPGTSKQKN